MDFSGLYQASDYSRLVAAFLVVGALMILPRVVRMGIAWIKYQVDPDPFTKVERHFEDAYGDPWAMDIKSESFRRRD